MLGSRKYSDGMLNIEVKILEICLVKNIYLIYDK